MRNIRAAIRFTLFFISTFGLYSIWFIAHFFIPNKPYWRQIIFTLWSHSFVRISKMTVEIIGTPPKAPFFLVSNHLSYADIPALHYAADGVFVAKGEIRGWFLAGKIVGDMGNIYIDRKNHRDIPRAAKEIIEKLDDGEGVIIFPEGTSTKGEEVLPFNSSFLDFAARTDLPVSYCSISYQTPDGEMPASEAVCWWDDTVFLKHLFRFFSVRELTAIINFGDAPVANPSRKALARELHEKVTEKFIPVL
jgi:1-acyl-sn-glycerol-3-phosphate acyltransferase